MRCVIFVFSLLVLFAHALAAADISGTWIAKTENPMMGEVEYVYELKVDSSGKITGNQRNPLGDSPIIDGKINGNEFELKVQTEFFGNVQVTTVKGTVEGETLKITPSMPGPGGGGRGIAGMTAGHCAPNPSPLIVKMTFGADAPGGSHNLGYCDHLRVLSRRQLRNLPNQPCCNSGCTRARERTPKAKRRRGFTAECKKPIIVEADAYAHAVTVFFDWGEQRGLQFIELFTANIRNKKYAGSGSSAYPHKESSRYGPPR